MRHSRQVRVSEPGGSSKDRIAKRMVEEAEKEDGLDKVGQLLKGLLEARGSVYH